MGVQKCVWYKLQIIYITMYKEWDGGDGDRRTLPEQRDHKYVHIRIYPIMQGHRDLMWGRMKSPRVITGN